MMAWAAGTEYSPSLQQTSQSPGAPPEPNAFSPSASVTQTTPVSAGGNGRKRKKSLTEGPSPDHDQHQSGGKQNHPVKRACNQCRQQKLRCDIVTEPDFKACSRCIKQNLHCAIDPGFRRQEKRQRHAEMERELDALKNENAHLRASLGSGSVPVAPMQTPFVPQPSFNTPLAHNAPFPGPNEAAASRSLLDLRQGFGDSFSGTSREPTLYTLGKVTLAEAEVAELISIYFANYHAYLPLLSPEMSYTGFFKLHPLLHWAMITTAARRYQGSPGLLHELAQPLTDLMWSTISSVPQTFHVVKALCLICTWPLPTSSTSVDPSMLICGNMVQLAMQFGLHRPSHAQDFTRYRINLSEEDIHDRMNTWVACNLVAQNISTGYGMPQISRWNWYTHGLHLDHVSPLFRNRCQIERFVDRVTRTLYTMQRDQAIQSDEAQRGLLIDSYGRDYEELETTIRASNATPIDLLYVQIASLHLRLTAFFDAPSAPTYRQDLQNLYFAASGLLKTFVNMPPDNGMMSALADVGLTSPAQSNASNYVMQMILAAGFTLLKLVNSFFATDMNVPESRTLFLATVTALRGMSVSQNDLPQRLAEVLAQLWRHGGAGNQRLFDDNGGKKPIDDSLVLKVRCRMSMSLLYDSIWRWKDTMGASASKNLDRAVEHPTIPVTEDNSENLTPGLTTDADLGLPSLDGWDNLNFSTNAPFHSLDLALDGFLDIEGFNFG